MWQADWGVPPLRALPSPAPAQGFPHRASLRTLAQRLLGRGIQEGAHDSAVDAEAALQAVQVGGRRLRAQFSGAQPRAAAGLPRTLRPASGSQKAPAGARCLL